MDKRRIAETIIKLQQAGKRMPQEMIPGADRQKEAQRILSETVDLWYSIFEPQKIGAERWGRAEMLALTLSGVQGLNVNIISPALMQAALKQAETEFVQGNVARNEEAKRQSIDKTPDGDAKMLLAWTLQRLAERREITAYMPTEEQIYAYGKQLGVSVECIKRQKNLLACFMSDNNYSVSTGMSVGSELLLNRETEKFTLKTLPCRLDLSDVRKQP